MIDLITSIVDVSASCAVIVIMPDFEATLFPVGEDSLLIGVPVLLVATGGIQVVVRGDVAEELLSPVLSLPPQDISVYSQGPA